MVFEIEDKLCLNCGHNKFVNSGEFVKCVMCGFEFLVIL